MLEVFGLFYKRAGFYLKVFVYGGGDVWKNNKRGGFIRKKHKGGGALYRIEEGGA